MSTPREIFEKDSSRSFRVHATHRVTECGTNAGVDVIAALTYEFDAGVFYAQLYVDDSPLAVSAIAHYIDDPNHVLKLGRVFETTSGLHGTDEGIRSTDLTFSRRVVAYTAFTMPDATKNLLIQKASDRSLSLVIRDGQYLAQRAALEKPMAFLSHDSRDKEPFVRDLASKLQQMLCTVWYDEFSLVPGQSLRVSIERGLKDCKKCVLILSPHFIGNDGWPRAEFDSVFTREILEKQAIVIPVWHGVTKEQVYQYCPRLVDKFAANSNDGVEEVARNVLRGINYES